MGEKLTNTVAEKKVQRQEQVAFFAQMTECEAIAHALELPELTSLMDGGYFNSEAFAVFSSVNDKTGEKLINQLYWFGGIIKNGGVIEEEEFDRLYRITRNHLLRHNIIAPVPKNIPVIDHWYYQNEKIRRKIYNGVRSNHSINQRRRKGIHRGQGRYSEQ